MRTRQRGQRISMWCVIWVLKDFAICLQKSSMHCYLSVGIKDGFADGRKPYELLPIDGKCSALWMAENQYAPLPST